MRNPEGEYQVIVPVLAKEEGEPVVDEEQKADEGDALSKHTLGKTGSADGW